MSRGPDAGTLLERRLVAAAATAGCAATVAAGSWRRWASATFVGAQHAITLTAADDAALAQWLAGLPEANLTLGGHHLLADVAVVGVTRAERQARVDLEALTVEQ